MKTPWTFMGGDETKGTLYLTQFHPPALAIRRWRTEVLWRDLSYSQLGAELEVKSRSRGLSSFYYTKQVIPESGMRAESSSLMLMDRGKPDSARGIAHATQMQSGTTATASPGSLLDMQNPKPTTDLLHRNLYLTGSQVIRMYNQKPWGRKTTIPASKR